MPWREKRDRQGQPAVQSDCDSLRKGSTAWNKPSTSAIRLWREFEAAGGGWKRKIGTRE